MTSGSGSSRPDTRAPGQRAARRTAAALALLFVGLGAGHAQQLYKYRDADGGWVYSDRQPAAGTPVETIDRIVAAEPPTVRVRDAERDGSMVLIAENTYHAPMQLALRVTAAENLGIATPTGDNYILPPRSESELMRMQPERIDVLSTIDFEYQYLPGDPGAAHAPPQAYRLPYAQATRHAVSQAYPEQLTHVDPSSWYAVDFEMPVGTGVHAARGGTVVETAANFQGAGTDLETDGSRANLIRVLHDDGTMALYAHLNRSSIRVAPGERIERGQYIADSGNTGFSTGPHLHFVVLRNRGGAIVSVPVEFAAIDGSGVVLTSGDEPTAY